MAGNYCTPWQGRGAKPSLMVLSRIKGMLLLCAVFCAGCELPPDEVESIREQLQAQLSRGQVYVIHSSSELSYMIRNSQFNKTSEADRDKLITSIETAAIDFLVKYQNYKHLKILFLGQGTAGIKTPYICLRATKACKQTVAQKA
jgi:hypothetical protein